jgi:predicted ester cyclase
MQNLNSTLAHRWFDEVWNNSKRESIDKLLATDAILNGLDTNNQKGTEGFKTFYDKFRMEFTDVQIIVEKVITEDDFESALCNVTAMHTGLGKKVNFSGVAIIRTRNGKIAESWNYFDFLTMYQQLGYLLSHPTA